MDNIDIWTALLALSIGIVLSTLLSEWLNTKKDSPHRHTERLSRIKNEIDNGTYVVDGKKIAAKMLGKQSNKREK